MSVSRDDVVAALEGIIPAVLIQGLVIHQGHIAFALEVTPENTSTAESLRQACEAALLRLDGVRQVTVALTAHRAAPTLTPRRPAPPPRQPVPNVKHIIAVASGKGGVGKSTTTVNLAAACQQMGLRVGIMDADIYGPSLPRLLNLKDAKPEYLGEKKQAPIMVQGMAVMSIGFMVEEAKALIWRGPMVMGAVQQLLFEVVWPELDILFVDMPPGTGDAHLTLVQRVPLAGGIIVSTPQDIALIDARRGLAMFQQVNVPVLGIIENMSYFLCPSCGARSDIFGHGGARDEATRLGVPFLGEIPLHMSIRETSDAGMPIVWQKPDSCHSEIYRHIAHEISRITH